MNPYAKAIDIIKDATPEVFRSLVIEVAKYNPGAIITANNRLHPQKKSYLDECKRLVSVGEIIQAIKLYRENTHAGLIEARDAIDAMR